MFGYGVVMGDVVPLRPRTTPEPGPEPLWRHALGEQLREERLTRSDRLVDVAGRAGLSPQYLSELERGLKEPSSEFLAAIAGALDLTVADLTSRISSRMTRTSSFRGPVCLAA